MRESAIATDTPTHLDTQLALLRLALGNAARSVPLQLCAISFIVYLGLDAGARTAAAVTGVIGISTGVWRWIAARRLLASPALGPDELARSTRFLELNAAAAGLSWVVSIAGIYPLLGSTMASTFVIMACGSIAVAAYFMALIGRAFVILAVLELGTLIAVSLFSDRVGSVSLAVLTAIFGATIYRAAREVRETTERAIEHGRVAELANTALQDALRTAEAAGQAKSQFLATMSHEIRTPMNGVLGALELLRRTPLEPRQKRLVRTAASSGETLMVILNDVLDQAKIEAGHLQLAAEPISLLAVASAVVGLFRSNAEAKGLQLRFDAEPAAPDGVIGDAPRLKQVLLNLVGNAIKFTDSGSVTLTLSPAPDEAGRVGVALTVSDTGIGIPPDQLGAVFEPFHQVDATQQRLRAGTGLGLAISQRIVKAMGSHIQLQSPPGVGSTFRFVLQLPPDLAAPVAQPTDTLPGLLDGAADLASATVMVVEDNEVNRMIVREMLLSMGVRVIEAADGAAALALLEQQTVDLVLMDLQMPVMDGFEATRTIRQRERTLGAVRVPIIAVTANAFDDDARRALAVGMDAHLAKPYSAVQLRSLLRQWL